MENSAGTGGTIGRSIGELASLVDALDRHPRLGICLDSCHLYASGYDVTDPDAVDALVAEVDATIGLDRLRALHVNDSATPLGSNRDRHANILEGEIGEGLGASSPIRRSRSSPPTSRCPAPATARMQTSSRRSATSTRADGVAHAGAKPSRGREARARAERRGRRRRRDACDASGRRRMDDVNAFAQAAESHLDDVYGYLVWFTGDRFVAEDLAGETFERALRLWHRFDPSAGSARTWLCQVARTTALDHFRSEKRRRRREAARSGTRAVRRAGSSTGSRPSSRRRSGG